MKKCVNVHSVRIVTLIMGSHRTLIRFVAVSVSWILATIHYFHVVSNLQIGYYRGEGFLPPIKLILNRYVAEHPLRSRNEIELATKASVVVRVLYLCMSTQ